MNHASLQSPRLRAVHKVLARGTWVSTWDISRRAGVCAVNSCIAELRCLGAVIETDVRVTEGKRIWFYRMTRALTLPGKTKKDT